ncbi:MAG: histidine kinase dimerization/phospho-acceptor domain-containing protein, partial [Miltoncostaeaceae bacterium]
MRRPTTLRVRLLVTVLAIVGVTLAVTLAAFNVLLAWQLDADAATVVRGRAAQELAAVRVVDGRVTGQPRAGATLETRAWIIEGAVPVSEPRVDPAVRTAALDLASQGGTSARVRSPSTLLHALPIMDQGRRVGTVVAGVPLAPYERISERALLISLAMALVILAATAVAARLLLRAAFQPILRMTRDAASWSDRDLDRRFAMGARDDEIGELAATLDGLLDRVAAGVRRERQLTAEVSHELRTPLAQIRAEVDLALRRPRDGADYRGSLGQIAEGADRLEHTIETLLEAARARGDSARGVSPAGELAGEAVRACRRLAVDRGVALRIIPAADGITAGVDRALGVRVLVPVIENACRHAVTSIEVEIARAEGAVVIRIADDGPGVPEDELEAIFEPGRHGSAGASDGSGAGLGLALARRLA